MRRGSTAARPWVTADARLGDAVIEDLRGARLGCADADLPGAIGVCQPGGDSGRSGRVAARRGGHVSRRGGARLVNGAAVARVLAQAATQMARDGGGLRYLGATPDGYVRLQLTGACAKCPRRMMTLDLAIETPLRSIGAARGVELMPSEPMRR